MAAVPRHFWRKAATGFVDGVRAGVRLGVRVAIVIIVLLWLGEQVARTIAERNEVVTDPSTWDHHV